MPPIAQKVNRHGNNWRLETVRVIEQTVKMETWKWKSPREYLNGLNNSTGISPVGNLKGLACYLY
jgi:hypothetical protein